MRNIGDRRTEAGVTITNGTINYLGSQSVIVAARAAAWRDNKTTIQRGRGHLTPPPPRSFVLANIYLAAPASNITCMVYGGAGTNICYLDIFIDDSAWKINCCPYLVAP